jgi:hypothetical protein
LVKTGQAEEVGSRVTGGDGAFGGPANGGGVVSLRIVLKVCSRASTDWLGKNILVGDDASKFKVSIG